MEGKILIIASELNAKVVERDGTLDSGGKEEEYRRHRDKSS